MRKAFVFAAVLAGLAALGGLLRSKMQNIDWEKRLAALPDNAPPKWMFRNITAIRENTDRIFDAGGDRALRVGSARFTAPF